MKSMKLVLLYGFLIWLIPFIIAFLIFPIHDSERPLFESIMAVVVTFSAVFFTILYFRKVDAAFFREGVFLGVSWFLISVAIDLPLFSAGPMKMAFVDYVKDIGLTYLIIPTVTAGMGFLLQNRSKSQPS